MLKIRNCLKEQKNAEHATQFMNLVRQNSVKLQLNNGFSKEIKKTDHFLCTPLRKLDCLVWRAPRNFHRESYIQHFDICN